MILPSFIVPNNSLTATTTTTTMLEIRHYDAQSSPIGQYIVIYFFLSYIIYAHLVDRISILSLIVGQQTRYSLFLVLRISCILRTVLIINLCQCLLLVSVFIFCPFLLQTSSPGVQGIYHTTYLLLHILQLFTFLLFFFWLN